MSFSTPNPAAAIRPGDEIRVVYNGGEFVGQLLQFDSTWLAVHGLGNTSRAFPVSSIFYISKVVE